LESAVSPLPSGGVSCDLDKVENELRSIFMKKPIVQLEVKMQEFSYEDSDEYDVSVISMKIPQVSLSREVTVQLQKELHDKTVLGELNKCMKTTIGFLSRTLARALEADDKMLLADYWKHVLASNEPIPSYTVKAHVQLCHLQALADLIEKTSEDEFTEILDQYKAAMPYNMIAKIELFANAISLEELIDFRGVFKRYIKKWCRSDDRRPADMLKLWVGFCPMEDGSSTLNEMDWFEDHFPDDMTHANAVEAFLIIHRSINDLKTQREEGLDMDEF